MLREQGENRGEQHQAAAVAVQYFSFDEKYASSERWQAASDVVVFDLRRHDSPARASSCSAARRTTARTSLDGFHPARPLLVWPLCGNEILFVHYTHKTYFLRILGSNARSIPDTDGDTTARLGLRMQLSTYRLAIDLDMFLSPGVRLCLSQLPRTLSWTL
ncbi:hypothetical protein CMQ_2245 [Grosmannia clavigera kw1407]|uniref:Uncharacterized protein n=1 Tax=Grosmannia clavigera (strain kw1407 / UAMH 11150) TaxID=655863 RepID=F0XIV7_GROCL|nr:uncharacterized protein CMQ_2245 [Grosmannia clavigera kw1407]EFX02196.1 hypothetical protein CMQ_2245 [Grosmannia clavigera kw1407]